MTRERIDELTTQIDALKEQAKPLEDERTRLWKNEHDGIAERVRLALLAQGDGFNLDELIFAATARCTCGAGYAYPEHCGMHGKWVCSRILMRQAEPGSAHAPELLFMFYEVKSEHQPSQGGATTRPPE